MTECLITLRSAPPALADACNVSACTAASCAIAADVSGSDLTGSCYEVYIHCPCRCAELGRLGHGICKTIAVPAILHAISTNQGSQLKGGLAVKNWHVGRNGRAMAAHLGYIWALTIMRCLRLLGVCSFCTAGDLSVGAASLCWLPASLT